MDPLTQERQNREAAMLEFATKVRKIVDDMGLSTKEVYVGYTPPASDSKYEVWAMPVDTDKAVIHVKSVSGEVVTWLEVGGRTRYNMSDLAISMGERKLKVGSVDYNQKTVILTGTGIAGFHSIVLPGPAQNRAQPNKVYVDESLTRFTDTVNGKTYTLAAMLKSKLSDFYITSNSVILAVESGVDLSSYEYDIAIKFLE
tara:strand:- start:140170 stop:140769 length:600 start_codon:yes stop_codon:yes gene_type:complete